MWNTEQAARNYEVADMDAVAKRREAQRTAIREWLNGDVSYYAREPDCTPGRLDAILIDGHTDLEKLLDRLDAIK